MNGRGVGRRWGVFGPWRAAAMVALTLAAALGGCSGFGYWADVIAGGKTIAAAYEPADRPTVVFVDDPGGRLTNVDLPGLIAGRVGQRLSDEGVLSVVVPAETIDRLKADHADAFAKWPIDEIGRRSGAEQVIYVLVRGFQVGVAEAAYRPTAEVDVKVIDATNGIRLYPSGVGSGAEAGVSLTTQQRHVDMDGATATARSIVARRLAEELASDIAKLFHDHKAPEPGERLPG